jgi:peptidyl-prolyl cis-trans isomerase B (cyclophilin B)
MIYGQVIQGMDIVDKMVKVETDSIDQPKTPISIDVNVIEMSKKQVEALGFTIPDKTGSMR